MENCKKGIGIIGFFDILGYSSFIENNTTTDASNIILNVLLNLKQEVTEQHKELFKGINNTENKKKVELIIDKIEWLIFSDTILLTLPYDPELPPHEKESFWFIFLVHCAFLYTHLFVEGLPLRGTITHGDFFLAKNCFAGKSIIDAYRETQELDLAAIIVSEKSKRELAASSLLKPEGMLGVFLHEYLVPFKNQKEAKRITLIPAAMFIEKTSEIRQLVLGSFWKHKKDIPQRALGKMNNTEMFFRSIKEIIRK